MVNYDLVILGATTTGLGLAQAVQRRKKTLIVNATEMVAYDVVNSYKQPGVYTRGAAYNKQFLDLQADVLLGTRTISIETDHSGYVLRLHGSGGYQTVRTEKLVDTTLERSGKQVVKTLNAVIIQPQGAELPAVQWTGIKLVAEEQTHAYRTAILKLECEQSWTVDQARHRLANRWALRPEELASWRIASIAHVFDQWTGDRPAQLAEGYMYLPAEAYAEPEESLLAGVELGRSWMAE